MYKASKKRFDDDADFKERARRAVTLLQGGDPDFIKAWERICEASRKVSSLSAQNCAALMLMCREQSSSSRVASYTAVRPVHWVLHEHTDRLVLA